MEYSSCQSADNRILDAVVVECLKEFDVEHGEDCKARLGQNTSDSTRMKGIGG